MSSQRSVFGSLSLSPFRPSLYFFDERFESVAAFDDDAFIDAFDPPNSDCSEAVGVINCCRLVRFLNGI